MNALRALFRKGAKLKRRPLTVNQSYIGEVINPITDGRLQMSLSSQGLAKKLGLSKQYMSRAEQGTYSSLNPALQKWVSNVLNISPESVRQRYVKFQQTQRRATVERIDPHHLKANGSEAPYITFERWRSGYWTSPMQFANAFCVHPDSVQKYEEGIQKMMPIQIRNALEEVNLLDPSWETRALSARLTP